MTRRTFPIFLAILLMAGSAIAMNTGERQTPSQRQALAAFPQDVVVELDGNDVPSWLMGRLAARSFSDPVAAAQDALDTNGAAFRRGADDGFAFRTMQSDETGETHVRMTQLYRGLPVVGGELIVHMTGDQIVGINGRFVADLNLDTRVALSASQLIGAAESHTQASGGEGISIVELGQTVVYAGDLEAAARTAVTVRLQYTDSEGLQIDDVYVDAQSGQVLGKSPRVFRAKSRKIYNMNQACISTGNEMPGTLMFSEGGTSSDTSATGAYNGTGTTYDYYKARYNRDSYDGAGAVIVSSVHGQFSNGASCTKNNAAWFDSPYNQMVYGDGDGTTMTSLALSLDVTGHEMTHAVTSRTSNLAYQKESGALNEAASDIMGESVAFYNGTGDWKIGAEIYTPGTAGDALRYFANPTADGYSADYYPERLYSGTCTPSNSNDQCGVHGNSGIANLYYYLLCQGGTHPRSKTTVVVPAIGIAKGEQIWYKALTAYMTSSTTFAGARTATASAATALYGNCSAEYIASMKAWDAVGVGGTWSCGTTYSISGNAGTTGAAVSAGGASATSDASSNYSIGGLAAGTFTVTPSKSGCTFSPASQSVTITTSNVTGVNFNASCTSTDTQLTSGVGVSGSVAAGAWKYYYITVPSGATNLTMATTGATGDVDIYTQFNAKPTSSSYTCRPYTSSGNESCSQASPTAGTWWIGVYGYAAGSYTVTATVTTGTVTYAISGNAGTTGATISAGGKTATSDASSNYTISGLANGTYTVTPSKSGCTFSPTSLSVTISGANATGKNFTATCGTPDTQLTSGVGVAGSVAASAWKYYYITVPSGATNLTFATTGATGDVDIYTQFNAKPTSSSYTCRPYTSSGNESCSQANPTAGTWWLGVYGYAAGSYTVTATVTTGSVTYSISGNVGTFGATVSAGAAGTTSDASSNYTIAGLANGTYTVTPSKTGCVFTPASQSVTISGANVTGKNFTANCSVAGTTLFTDGFESTGWATAQVSGTAGSWTLAASGTHPSAAPHAGTKLAVFNSYTAASGNQTRLYRTAGFAIASTYTSATLKFWMYHDTGYSTYADKVQVQVSTNGSTWTNVGTAVNRYDGSTGWKQATIDLSAYKGQTVYLAFVGVSAYGNDTYLDDVTVTAQ